MTNILSITIAFLVGAIIGGYIGWVTGQYHVDPFLDDHWQNQDFDDNGVRDERSGWQRFKDWLNVVING